MDFLLQPVTPPRPKSYASFSYRAAPTTSIPLTSSPLSTRCSSGAASTQSRRLSQYKSRSFSSSSACQWPSPSTMLGSSSPMRMVDQNLSSSLLRDKIRAKCVERAQKARRERVSSKRWGDASFSSDASSDVEMDAGSEQDENEDAMDDELFRRIVANEQRRAEHKLRLSYEHNMGSSIDPDMEDIASWETELQAAPPPLHPAPEPERSPTPPADIDIPDEDFDELYRDYLSSLENQSQQMES